MVLPCESLTTAISMKEFHLINREERRCRNDYPISLKNLLKNPLAPRDLFNAILAPDLPYDQTVCEHLCISKYWLPISHCIKKWAFWLYTEIPKNVHMCSSADNDEGRNTSFSMFKECECFKRCDGFDFEVTAQDKIRHAIGNF